jgi:hypothetical protein
MALVLIIQGADSLRSYTLEPDYQLPYRKLRGK